MTQNNLPYDASKPADPPATGPDKTPPAPKPKPKRRWLRRVAIGVGAIVVFLIIVIALIPTILSTGAARSFATKTINENLNGSVDISSWSFSWTGGVKVDGVKVFDDSKRQILEIGHFSTDLSLFEAAKGKFHLGKTVVDGLNFFAILSPDGSINFSKLSKSTKSAGAPASPSASGNSAPTKLPEVQGEIQLVNCRGTFQSDSIDKKTKQVRSDAFQFSSIEGTIKIPNINESITDNFKVVASLADGHAGKVDVDGTINVVKNNTLITALDQMNVLQNVTLSGDLASALGFLPMDLKTFGGAVEGLITVDLDAGHAASAKAYVQISDFKLGGNVIKGDTYAADSITLTVPVTTIDLAETLGGSDNYHLKVGGDSKEPITLVVVNTIDGKPIKSTVALTADLTPGMLKNVAAGKTPGAEGNVGASIDFDLTPIARMMPHLLSVMPNKQVKTGKFSEKTDVRFSANQTLVDQSINVTDITALDTVEHRTITIAPLIVSAKATDLGGGGKIPDLRDILVQLTTTAGNADPASGFAKVQVTGKTLGDVAANIHVDLNGVVKEYGQLIDFGKLHLGGTLDVLAGSKGDLIGNGQAPTAARPLSADASLTVTGKDLEVAGLREGPPLKEPILLVTTTATLERGVTEFISNIKNLHTTVKTGNLTAPTVDIDLGGSIATKSVPSATDPAATSMGLSSADFTINKFAVNPTLAQQEFGAFLPLTEDKLTFRGGMLEIGGTAHYDGKSGSAKLQVVADKLQLDKANGADLKKVLDGYTLTTALAANFVSDAGSTQITLSQLSISDAANSPDAMVGIENADGKPIKLVSAADGTLQGAGSLHIVRLNLARLMEVSQAFSAPPLPVTVTTTPGAAPATPAPEGKLVAGLGAGSVDLSTNPKGEFQADVHLGLTGVTYTVAGAKGLNNEEAKLEVTAVTGQGMKTATLQKCDLTTSVMTAHVTAEVRPKEEKTLDMIRSAVVQLEIPSFAILQEKLNAITPPAPAVAGRPIDDTASASNDPASVQYALAAAKPNPKAGAPAAAAPTPPTEFSAGSALVKVIVNRDPANHLIIAPDVATKGLELSKGGVKDMIGEAYVRGQIAILSDVAPAAATLPSPAPPSTQPTTKPSVMDEISGIQLKQLALFGVGSRVICDGIIEDPMHARRLNNVTLDLFYNSEMLWKAILPLMSTSMQTQFKDAKVSGNYDEKFVVTGAYPADVEMNKAIANLNLAGTIQLDLFDGQGVTLKNFILPIRITQGVASIDKPDKQDFTAELNSGHLNLHGITADLRDPHMLVTITPGSKILDNVSLNSILATNLGDFINNPLMVGADEAAGSLTMTINTCDKLPTDDTLTQAVASNQGVLDLDMPISKLQIGNENIKSMTENIAKQPWFGHKTIPVTTLQGSVQTFHVHMEHAITTEAMVIAVTDSKRPIKLNGTVAMATKMINMTLELPFSSLGVKLPKQAAAILGDSASIVLTGPVDHPNFDLGANIQKNLQGDLIKGLLGKGDKDDNSSTQPSQPDSDPLKDLINSFGKKKKK